MMKLIANPTIAGNTIQIVNIPTNYKRLILKGSVKTVIAGFYDLRILVGGVSSVTTMGYSAQSINVGTWNSYARNYSYISPAAQVPGSDEANLYLNFEVDFNNQNDGFVKQGIGWASVSGESTQYSDLMYPTLNSTAQITSLTIANAGGATWNSNSTIHLYGIE